MFPEELQVMMGHVLWDIEMTRVNMYMMYRCYCTLKSAHQVYDHHSFREAIGYALIGMKVMLSIKF